VALKPNRVRALDGVRGLAIGLVLLWHGFFVPLSNIHNHPFLAEILALGRLSWSGVDLFFVLSGFLIGGILLDAVDSNRYFVPFYVRRAYRIVPLYAAVLTTLFLVPLLFPSFGAAWMRNRIPLIYYGTFLQNYWMAGHGFFGSNILFMTWSLAVEEQFYLTLPVTIRYVSRSRLWWLVGGMVAGAPLLRMLLNFSIPHGPLASYVLMPCRADALGLGLAVALMKRTPPVWERVLRSRRYVYVALAGACLAVAALLLRGFNNLTNEVFGLEYSLLGFLYFSLLLTVLINRKFEALFSARVLCYLGTIAYGLYLLHPACLSALHVMVDWIRPAHSGWLTIGESIMGIALAMVLAAISWECLEKPLIHRGHRYKYDEESIEQRRTGDRMSGIPEVTAPSTLAS
jgi:peptidoglycan/LPS O-acetylase OafA/YrhL